MCIKKQNSKSNNNTEDTTEGLQREFENKYLKS